jgi:hypothetical protein
MKRQWKTWLAMTAVFAAPLVAAEAAPKLTVFVYNYAAIGSDDLANTEQEAARIYGKIGVEIQWLDCALSPRQAARFPACQIATGPTKLAVRILPRSMAERMRRAHDCFGFALYPEDPAFATVANVFAHLAEQIADRHRLRPSVILGHIVAHELGHLLLGPGSHSSQGIMRAPWLRKELERVAQGSMTFLPRESQSIQSNVRARMAAEAKPGS